MFFAVNEHQNDWKKLINYFQTKNRTKFHDNMLIRLKALHKGQKKESIRKEKKMINEK